MGEQYKTIDKFDKALGELVGLPDVATVKPGTYQKVTPIIGKAQTFTVQTLRQREAGDWIFITYLDDDGAFRLVIPPKVADLIASQRDALTTKNRKRAGRERAAADKAAGKVPGFLKGKKKGAGS